MFCTHTYQPILIQYREIELVGGGVQLRWGRVPKRDPKHIDSLPNRETWQLSLYMSIIQRNDDALLSRHHQQITHYV